MFEEGDRTLRITDVYGKNVTLGGVSFPAFERMAARERRIIDVFTRAGYAIIVGGQPDVDSPRELGFFLRHSDFKRSRLNKKIAEETGAQMPQEYKSIEGILSSEGPIVAKLDFASDGGKGKYLLQTRMDKVKFLAAVLVKEEVFSLFGKSDQETRDRMVQEIFEKIERREFDDPMLEGELKYFTVQDFIETPGDRYTSYRIVADAAGKIHCILLLYSRNKKHDSTIRQEDIDVSKLLGFDRIFLSPDSPFCISSQSIVSNFARGGGEINFLFGGKKINEEERQILLDHGLDPDRPRLPRDLIELVREMGRASRYDSPLVGFDFLQNGSGDNARYYFLEANFTPIVDPADVGLDPESFSHEDVQLILMEKVAKRFAKGTLRVMQ